VNTCQQYGNGSEQSPVHISSWWIDERSSAVLHFIEEAHGWG
jgi:hypothetical protein